ncbi:YihY/virulence factor BrkB family protein [Blastococcus capsensis]|uniref:YihY/virulence factor BrkB family protein n=1 Tax=Blastococcus capsensis TaxID=1564163 RepID=UPI002541A36F|nr:YihY/virulence factor BrkB family protein [Blastococcus capsensis]MDK3255466.1 YihY/virulence factor BrkB family protein [Blastococcus capsensis]
MTATTPSDRAQVSRALPPGAGEWPREDAGRGRRQGLRSALRGVVPGVRDRLVGRDLALIAAGLTFYAGIAVVPLLVLSFGLTAWLTSAERVHQLGVRVAELLPEQLGAPDAVARLVDAGARLDLVGALLALLPMSLYGEGLRRALLRFGARREGMTGWRGRLAALPLLLLTPVLLYPLLLAASLMADLAARGGLAATAGQVALGYYSVLAALTVPLAWGFRVVGGSRVRWPALTAGALFTAACLSGFLQGFVLFLGLPLDLGAPFGGLDLVGGVVALGLWLFALHVVVLCGWLATQSLDQELARHSARGQAVGRPPVEPGLDPG